MARNPAFPIVNVNETAKTRWRAVPYTAGRGLDIGCGAQRLFETEFVCGVDNGRDGEMGLPVTPNVQIDAVELAAFSAGQWDYAYSSYLLQYFPYKQVPEALRNWMRVIKTNAHVVLYLPDEKQYPKCAEPERGIPAAPDAHPRQLWNVNYDRVVEAMAKTAWNWDLVDYQVCDQNDEYSLFFAFKKLK